VTENTLSARRTADVSSEATRVTFFEDRAEVQRRARCAVAAGVSWVRVAGVSVSLDDPSLVPSIVGESARVIAARILRRTVDVPALDAHEAVVVERELRDAECAVANTSRALARAHETVQRIRALTSTWGDGVLRVPGGGEAGAARWKSALDALRHACISALDEVARATTSHDDAQEQCRRAQARYDLARVVHQRYEAVIEVQVEAREATEVELTLSYRTPCAVWRPEHQARLVARNGGGYDIELRTWATAWQCTGEHWNGVASRFSTARPLHSASAPLLRDDVLALRRKTEVERRTVTVDVREQTVAVAGVHRGTRVIEEMPGVDDGGEALCFDAPHRATFPSDGAPVRVELTSARVACEVDRVAYPERSAAVHLRATATLAGATALLAGPVVVGRAHTLVGRGRTGFVARGEPFELGFGVDDGLRVRRQVEEKREVTTVMGTQKIMRTVRVFVSNLSGEARKLTVCERVPVSEIKDVEVAIVSLGGARHDARDGFVRWEVEVPVRGTHEAMFSYRIEASSKVALPF
jgi:uncharacterized protein (TIGR02231 family)